MRMPSRRKTTSPALLANQLTLRHDRRMTDTTDILCIGAAHWDVIGHSPRPFAPGDDLPGTIYRSPGGVALNIARTLVRLGHRPALIAAIGQDAAGDALVSAIDAIGIDTRFLHRPAGLSTDAYLAIEGANGLIAAIAASTALETLDLSCIAPLIDGRLGAKGRPWHGSVVLDSGLSPAMLQAMAQTPPMNGLQLCLSAASPAKAGRLKAFLGRPDCSFYLNLAEAGQICDTTFSDSATAAQALLRLGAVRVLVTNGPHPATDADATAILTRPPPTTFPQRVTGAGDEFMGVHISQEIHGTPRHIALMNALNAAAAHVAHTLHS